MNTTTNPLQKFYRVERLSIRLPSRGAYYSNNVVELNEDGEVGVMPMTAADEILLKNPNALLTGKAVADVIESCVPAVKNSRKLLACDIDALMLAIRSASFGDDSEMRVTCPNKECGHENSYTLNLDSLLNESEELEEEYEVILPSGVGIYLRPGDFDSIVKQNKTLFENSKVQRALADPEISDHAAMQMLADVFANLSRLNFDIIKDAIIKVVFDDEEGNTQEVTNKKHIEEFLKNIDSKSVEQVEDKILEIDKKGITRTIPAKCVECETEWEAPVEFNPVNFS